MDTLRRLSRSARRVGPYVLIELLLPGGTLLALLLWLSQHLRLQPGAGAWRLPEQATPAALVHTAR